MRKSLKKGMAMLLAAAMVFSTPVAMDQAVAKAAGTELPAAIYEHDFETTDPAKGSIKGNGEIVDSGDAAHGKVFQNAENGMRTNYFQLPENVFSANAKKIAEKKGVTISFALNANQKASQFSPLFAAYAAEPKAGTLNNESQGTVNEAPMLVVQGRQLIQYNVAQGDEVKGWCDFTDKQNVNGANVESFEYMKDNKWHTVTVTIAKNKAAYYVDGIVVNAWNYTENDPKGDGFFSEKGIGALKKICLGGNQAWNFADKDPAYMFDDVKIYAESLSASQVYKLATGNDAEVDKLLGDATAELSQDGKQINLKYNTMMKIPAEDLSISVNDKVVATGSAVSATPVSGTATFAYTPNEDGEYKFTVKANEQTVDGKPYLEQTVTTAAIKIKKEGEKYVYDADLFEGFKAEEGSEGLNITWKALNGATVSAKVTGGGKTISLTTPGTVKFDKLTAGTKYTVTLTATKAGYATKTATADYTYSTKFEKYTVGTTDKKTAFWKAMSKPYQINDRKTRVVELEVHGGTKIHNNFALAFANQENFDEKTRGSAYTEYAVVRPDKYGWAVINGTLTANKSLCGKDIQYVSHSLVSGGKTMKMGDTGFDAAYIAIMDSANATVEIARSGKVMEITMKIASTKNAKNVITSVTKFELGTKDGKDNGTGKVYMRMTPDESYFIVKNVTEKAAGEIKPPTDTDNDTDGGSTAKVSKVSITVPNRKAGKTIYMKKGDKVTLKATVKGSGKYSKSVTWKSSKTKIATVKNGKVTAKKAGTAKITATSKTDKSKKATITIKVSKKAVKNKVLKISPTRKTLKKGKSLPIKIKKITKKTTDKITYKSSKKSVATVDAYGKVKAKKKGKATITVKCGKKSAKLKLTVKK